MICRGEKIKDPYHVWVSEIMLQQTRVEAVRDYYRRWMEALPNVQALAQTEEETLLKLWQGLGYYNRVRNMQKAARMIMEEYEGSFPERYEEILKLPRHRGVYGGCDRIQLFRRACRSC